MRLAALRERFANLPIVGAHHGYYFGPIEVAENDVSRKSTGLPPTSSGSGSARRNSRIGFNRHKPALRRGVLLAVGFAFDVNAGLKKDAPSWMQRAGLTWAFRAFSEPQRLLTRYLRYNSLFLYYLLKDAFRPTHP